LNLGFNKRRKIVWPAEQPSSSQ